MQLGPQYDLAARLAALEDQVRRMQSNGLGQAFSSTQSDGSVGMQIGQNPNGSGATATQWYQGPTTSRDPNTGLHPGLAYIGELFSGGVSVDSGAIFARPDGSTSMVIGNRGVQIVDKFNNTVVGTDEFGASPTGKGLAYPLIGYGPALPSVGTNWPSTTAASLSSVAILSFPAQHAQVAWSGQVYCPAGTTGQVQVQINNGAAGPVHSCGAGYTTIGPELIPLGTWGVRQGLTLTGLAAVTSGAGPIYFGINGVWGQGSA
jgi:hypothetical protein